MIFFPMTIDIMREEINASPALNEIYWNNPAPGKFKESR
jgi:hypothetical protein